MTKVSAGEFEDAEWVNEDLADLTGVDVPVETVNVTNALPIIGLIYHEMYKPAIT